MGKILLPYTWEILTHPSGMVVGGMLVKVDFRSQSGSQQSSAGIQFQELGGWVASMLVRVDFRSHAGSQKIGFRIWVVAKCGNRRKIRSDSSKIGVFIIYNSLRLDIFSQSGRISLPLFLKLNLFLLPNISWTNVTLRVLTCLEWPNKPTFKVWKVLVETYPKGLNRNGDPISLVPNLGWSQYQILASCYA